MSMMSEIATDLELNWYPASYGYRHENSTYEIHWWNSNRDTVSLFRHEADEYVPVLDGKLHDAVHFVMTESLAWAGKR